MPLHRSDYITMGQDVAGLCIAFQKKVFLKDKHFICPKLPHRPDGTAAGQVVACLCIAFQKKFFLKNKHFKGPELPRPLTASPAVRITAGGAGIAAGEGCSRCMSAPDGSRAQDPPQAMTRRFWAHKNPGQSSRFGGLSGFLYAFIPPPAGQAAPRSAHPPPRPLAA